MGDENSIAGQTKGHKHSALASDGGFLETSVTGITNLSEGSIVYGDASEVVTELTAGSDGDALQISSGIPTWTTGAAGVTVSGQQAIATNGSTTTSSTLSPMPNVEITLPNRTGGLAFIHLIWQGLTTAASGIATGIEVDGVQIIDNRSSNGETSFQMAVPSNAITSDTNGDVVKGLWAIFSGTGTIYNPSRLTTFEVS